MCPARTFVARFSMAESSKTGLDVGNTVDFSSSITNGAFGVVASEKTYFGGYFTSVGPYATTLIDLGTNSLPSYVSIGQGVISSSSGRVIVATDISVFADEDAGGYFLTNEALSLKSVEWILVPEPGTLVSAGAGATGPLIAAFCRRRAQSFGDRRQRSHNSLPSS
jgi:hypothetical protein